MSLLLAAIAAAALCASAGGGYVFASMRRPKPPGGGDGGDGDDRGRGKRAPPPGKREKDEAKRAFEGLPLALGDVVVAEGEERWLAGGIVAKEGERVVAAVLFAPEGSRTKVVVAFARPRRDILWLAPAEVDAPSEPPASCLIAGSAMTRRSRLPVAISRHGQGVPNLGEVGILAEYEGGADEVALLVTSEGRAFGWSGRRLVEGDYDRLGSGGDDEA